MATYKVIQDIEAEDKLVGPLSLRQFIYAGIAALSLWLAFIVATKVTPLAAVIFLPPVGVFGFFAFPWSGEQPTEVWALAKIQFLMKPRKRIWNQSGVKELVTITVPKKIEHNLTNGLSQVEVRSRLQALADTIDSRGWVIKNVGGPVPLYAQGAFGTQQSSERLLSVAAAPAPNLGYTEQGSDDVLDMQNPVAQKFNTMINASEKAHRAQLMARMQAADTPTPPAPAPSMSTPPVQPPNDYWFLNQPSQGGSSVPQDAVTFNTQVVEPGAPAAVLPVSSAIPTADEEAFVKQLKNQPLLSPNMHGHLHVIQPLSQQQASAPMVASGPLPQPPMPLLTSIPGPTPLPGIQSVTSTPVPAPMPIPSTPPTQQVTPAADAAILDLARNDDLNVATIAREAQKRKDSPDEVVISLH